MGPITRHVRSPVTGIIAVVTVVVAVMTGSCATLPQAKVRIPRPHSTRDAFDQLKGPGGTAGVVTMTDNAYAWGARWELVTDARSTIDFSTFIFDNDVFGFALLGALTERALAGVKVRMLLDGRGSMAISTSMMGRDYLQEMVETGNVDIHIFNPPFDELVGALVRFDAVQLSAGSHNKILVVDDAIALVGGRNVNSHYFATLAEDPNAVADADVLMDGALVAEVTDIMDREFSAWRRDDVAADAINFTPQLDELLMFAGAMDAWVRGRIEDGSDDEMLAALAAAARTRIDHDPSPRTLDLLGVRLKSLIGFRSIRATVPTTFLPRTQVDARVVATLSRARALKSNAASDALLRAIGGARKDIVIQSPSFILNPQLLRAFEEASARGVTITLLTNSPLSSDSRISQALFIDSWPELMARIPTLRIFTPRLKQMQHAKRAVFDDELSFIGTYNLDPFSTKMNSETIVATWSLLVAAQTRTELMAKLPQMDEYRIARDFFGQVQRHPEGHSQAGQVVVKFGPRDQVPQTEIDTIEAVKAGLLGLQNLWDFDVEVW
jgi:putative cardiolipin synthase